MESPSYRRRRPALSCNECRRRKIKCDRKTPCVHCVATSTNCTYKTLVSHSVTKPQLQSNDVSGFMTGVQNGRTINSADNDQACLSESIESIDEYEVTRTVSEDLPGAREQSSLQHISSRTTDPSLSDHSRTTKIDLRSLLKRVENLEKSQPARDNLRAVENNSHGLVLEPELRDAQVSQNKSRVLRWHQWMGASQGFATIQSCFTAYIGNNKEAPDQSSELAVIVTSIQDLLTKCKTTARTIKLSRPSRSLLCPDFRLSPPSREMADKMVNQYLQSFESVYRIVHIPTFWTEYEKYWMNPENAPIYLRLKILLVVAVGSSLERYYDLDVEFRHALLHWVHAAQSWLSGPLEKDRLDISGIQIHCLTILARQVLSIGGDLIWVSMGSLVHEAMQIGLHRDPKHFPRMSVLQAEVRRRLWATVIEMTTQSSLDSGMPPRITSGEYDTLPPFNVNDDEIVESSAQLELRARDVFTKSSLQRLLLTSLPVRLRAVQLLNGMNSELSYDDVLTLTSELIEACQSSGAFVEMHKTSGISAFQRNLLDFMLRRFLLPLHFPFASEACTNSMFAYSLKLSLDTALAIVSPEPNEEYNNLITIGGGMFKMGLRCAVTAISLELLSQVESQRLNGTLQRSSQYVNFLMSIMKDTSALTLERVKCGETNVKGYMFLSMIMAQVKAAQAGSSCELEIARSAKESLELCYGILCTQIENSSLLSQTTTDFSDLYNGEGTFGMELDFDFFSPDRGFT